MIKTRGVSVFQCNEYGVPIRCFDSIKEAASTLGIRSAGIARCLSKDRKTYKGFTWQYRDSRSTRGLKAEQKPSKKVEALKEEIKRYEQTKEIIPKYAGSYSFIETAEEENLLCNALSAAIDWGNKN